MESLGLHENVLIRPQHGRKWKRFKAKIDTGAKWSRIGVEEAVKLRLGPIINARTIRTGTGSERRIVVPASVKIGKYRVAVQFTISTRRSGVLIGRRTIGKRFRIIPSKSYVCKPANSGRA